jgi:hypothetical protein
LTPSPGRSRGGAYVNDTRRAMRDGLARLNPKRTRRSRLRYIGSPQSATAVSGMGNCVDGERARGQHSRGRGCPNEDSRRKGAPRTLGGKDADQNTKSQSNLSDYRSQEDQPRALLKPLQPSKELAAVVGPDPLPRGQVVRKVVVPAREQAVPVAGRGRARPVPETLGSNERQGIPGPAPETEAAVGSPRTRAAAGRAVQPRPAALLGRGAGAARRTPGRSAPAQMPLPGAIQARQASRSRSGLPECPGQPQRAPERSPRRRPPARPPARPRSPDRAPP